MRSFSDAENISEDISAVWNWTPGLFFNRVQMTAQMYDFTSMQNENVNYKLQNTEETLSK